MSNFVKGTLTYVELLLPVALSAIVTPILINFGFNPGLNRFEKLVDGSITCSAIIVGFLAAMLGILVSIKETKVVKAIFSNRTKSQLAVFFSESIFLGFLVIGSAGSLYLVMDSADTRSTYVFIAWTALLLWFLFSAIRIIIVMLLILFHDTEKNERPEGNALSDEEREQARMMNARKR
ncbi:hypothetical protein [Paenibacillus lactis]|uniref:Transmembrane protein n=1 Tax=Paenibacillus lactis 154 TaxID=743719 RepID=G4HEI2_9BACL|nr:hypothetical protein [Paenibacillus lactis]EHB65251.1 hypothetical protein PaelaDRAFT_2393 [Paenibacillus lactis 154]